MTAYTRHFSTAGIDFDGVPFTCSAEALVRCGGKTNSFRLPNF